MVTIQVTGRINEAGQIELDEPTHLPPGEVIITIEAASPEEYAADEAQWGEQFAKSQDMLIAMARKAIAEDEAGLTEDFDPDNDPDAL